MVLIDINGYNMYVIMYVIYVYINIGIIVNYIELYTIYSWLMVPKSQTTTWSVKKTL